MARLTGNPLLADYASLWEKNRPFPARPRRDLSGIALHEKPLSSETSPWTQTGRTMTLKLKLAKNEHHTGSEGSSRLLTVRRMYRKASKSGIPAAHERWSIHNFRLRIISLESAARVPALQDTLEPLVISLTEEECYLQHHAQWPLLACRRPHNWLHPGQSVSAPAFRILT